MNLRQFAVSTRNLASRTAEGLARLARLERFLAAVCLAIPALLIGFDHGPIRESISAYYSMEQAQVFYVPLTVAAMLFVVNGVVKKKRAYNTRLGLMLIGVVLFNHDDFSRLHTAFAVAFFGGNAVVMVWYSPKKELWFKVLLVGGIVLAMAGCYWLDWFTLFYAEWLSFGIIAAHYILESRGIIE